MEKSKLPWASSKITPKIGLFAILLGGFITPNMVLAQNKDAPIIMPTAAETAASRALEKIDELETQFRTMTDKIERLEAASDNLKTENQRLAKLLDEANAKIINLEGAKTTEIKKTEEKITPPAPIAKTDELPIPVKKPVENIEEKKAPIQVILGAPQYLDNAKLAIQSNEFEKAIQNLVDLLKNHPNAIEVSDARWLLGETYFTRGEWLNAAKTYIEYLQKDKNGARVSDVLVRLASSYRELGDNKQRCIALKAYKERTKSPSAILKARADDEIAKGVCP